MAFSVYKLLQLQNYGLNSKIPGLTFKRCGHTIRGKPPGIARTLEQRLIDENQVAIEAAKINIGFPKLRVSRKLLRDRLSHLKEQRQNPDYAKLATRNLKIDLNQVRSEWIDSSGPFHIQRIAQHHGIYSHLFGDGYFVPRVALDIAFANENDVLCPVYTGNIIKPSEACAPPNVKFDHTFSINENDKKQEKFYSLVLTNPDGHLEDQGKEYVHWFVANIPGGDVSAGEQIVPYIQPFPSRGTGFHRYVFILYRHNQKVDFSNYKITEPHSLSLRTFETLDFYEKHQDDITPAGLAFFQSDWEPKLTKFYHDVLNIAEPIFEYDFPKPYIKEQKWFPLKEPFNLYMDKYRDPKVVNREYLEKKLAKVHPFEGPEKPLRFPNAHPIKGVPSWQKTQIKKDRLGWGRINDV